MASNKANHVLRYLTFAKPSIMKKNKQLQLEEEYTCMSLIHAC